VDAGLEQSAAAGESIRETEGVLSAMLGPLYVKNDSLKILEVIGEGGFATVHRARMTHENGMTQFVAIKMLRDSCLVSSDNLKEFIAVRCCLWYHVTVGRV
jgi:hypothetical protein